VTNDFQQYLRAKRTVDDRALDRRLVRQLRARLRERAATTDGPLRVLEVGAGIGTMIARLLEWEVLPLGTIRYTAVDVQAENVAAIEPHLREWAADRSISVLGTDPIVLEHDGRRVEVEPVVAEAVSHAEATPGAWDVLVGAALLDILDLDGLAGLLGALSPGGCWYFPITFDGATRFRPGHPADRTIERSYHAHMDAKSGGSSRAGGDVLDRLQQRDGVRLLGVAGSDWVVRPVDGAYPADEARFLRHILDTIETAVSEHADDTVEVLDEWLAERRAQVDAAELVYLTHQLDVLGRVDESGASDEA
jgi:SAM-dependent methyltransferase